MQQRLRQSPVSGCLVKGCATDEELVAALLPLLKRYISRSLRRKILRMHRENTVDATELLIVVEFHLDTVASHHGLWFARNPMDASEVGFYEDTLFD